MDKKAVRTFLFVLFLLLVLSLLLFLAQSAAARENARVFEVSVIVPETGEAFEKGMDKASRDHNVDVHVASAGAGDAETQIEQLRREIENGVDAIVLRPVDDTVAYWLSGQKTAIPIVCIGETNAAGCFRADVTEDNEELGRLLAGAVAAAAVGGETVTVFCSEGDLAEETRCGALLDALAAQGVGCRTLPADGALETFCASDRGASVLVALNPDATARLAADTAENDRIFGAGTDSECLYQCASGRVEALAVWSDYEAAYLGLSAAACAAAGEKVESVTLKSYLADKNNLFEDPLVRILFPAS